MAKSFYVPHDQFSVDKGLNYPHIIDCPSLTKGALKELRLPDAIVTFLFHYDPGVLEKFFDFKTYSGIEIARDRDNIHPTMVIARKDRLASLDYIVDAEICNGAHCGILPTGEWKPVSAAEEGEWYSNSDDITNTCAYQARQLIKNIHLADKAKGSFSLYITPREDEDDDESIDNSHLLGETGWEGDLEEEQEEPEGDSGSWFIYKEHANFPTSMPIGWPHIINYKRLDEDAREAWAKVRLADSIATYLLECVPDMLEPFFNVDDIDSCSVLRERKDVKDMVFPLLVERKGRVVEMTHLGHDLHSVVQQWRCTIGENGDWKARAATACQNGGFIGNPAILEDACRFAARDLLMSMWLNNPKKSTFTKTVNGKAVYEHARYSNKVSEQRRSTFRNY